MKPRCFCHIRDLPHYRRDAFVTGARAAGFEVTNDSATETAKHGDIVMIWNRYGHYHDLATRAEKRGALVLVSENGFVGRDAQGRQFYQLAIHGHNGSGVWYEGEGSRLESLGIAVSPWQADGPDGHVVVRGQRGIGRPGVASPPNWHQDVAERLRKLTRRKVIVVPHPGATAVDDQKHVEYLAGAHALVVWSSSVGVKALVLGVPVVAESPYWVCKSAAVPLGCIDSAFLRTQSTDAARRAALHRMAWAQWSLDEIATGVPITHLLTQHAAQAQQEALV